VNSFDEALGLRLAALRQQGLLRELRRVDSPPGTRLRMGGQTLLNFSSNDYLGLANEPRLKQAAVKAVENFGAGSGAARLISGSLAPHHDLEEALAHFKGTEAAVSFATGYITAIGTICALVGRNDVIILDKLVHACIVDAARLSGAKIRVFAHNDLEDLERILKWANRGRSPKSKVQTRGRLLIVTESIFSMDGDAAPLGAMAALKEKHGAWLMVDEAHATGLYGKQRRGLAEESGVSERIEIQMGTLGKAVGAAGGYICGSRALIDFLVNQARSFVFSTAPVPAAAAAAAAGIRLIQSAEGETRRRSLWQRVAQLQSEMGNPAPPARAGGRSRRPEISSAIIPVLIGDEAGAVAISAALRERGLFVPAIRYPTVARGRARLRATVTAAHKQADISELCDALAQLEIHNSNPA
jgi:8-amino-7-oxononanoate synthase